MSFSHITPSSLMAKIIKLIPDKFDLDPCSHTKERHLTNVEASKYFTDDDNGLGRKWFGYVYMNPPYNEIPKWVTKCRNEVYGLKNAKRVIALLPASTSTKWFHTNVAYCPCIIFLRKRIRFGNNRNNARFDSMIAIYDNNFSQLQKSAITHHFRDHFIHFNGY